MAVKALDLFEKLKKEEIHPVYFLTGNESYLRNAALELILSRTVDPATRDFNFAVFQGGDADIERVMGQASSYPMLSDRRTVVIKNVNQMDAASLDAIGSYVRNPVSSTVLVLEGPALPAKSGLMEALRKNRDAVICEFKSLYEENIPRWIKSYARRNGKAIDDVAAHHLIERTGTDLQNLSNEIDKLILYVGQQKSIGEAEIRIVTGASRQFSVFELQNAIGAGDINRALHILNHMLTEGESPAGIIVMLTRYFSSLWKLKLRRKDEASKTELAREIGVHHFFLNDYISASNRYRADQLERVFEQLMFADLGVKRGTVNIPLALTIPIIALVRPELFGEGISPLAVNQIMN